ncbi:MAG: AbrB/MazE/SpoVT family DNA-binding domain-containing protein [Proteobacteria bacterium]|nr:AbrB/MazE/SpoVT family DNA-binding domain-containing protein [Pseudomonadota bacterium]MBU1741299.1 AbrB/MazE/SpoVT family DNA-binding domain-containing protein [Pseudomonadota bacterium]
MPKKLQVDAKKLLKMVKDGVPQKEIMSRLGFKTSTQLKTAITNAAMAEKILPPLVGGRKGGKQVAIKKNVKVNSRGSLIIPKQLIDAYGLKVGDSFEVRRSKAGMSLKKV